MNTDSKLQIVSTDSNSTETIAAKIGKNLRGGEVFELSSDLGGGKTTFTRGLVAGAGSIDVVASPTFTVSRVYSTPRYCIHHFDFYRLESAGIMANEISELLKDTTTVVIIEWASIVNDILPESRVRVAFTPLSDNERTITFTYSQRLAYLFTELS